MPPRRTQVDLGPDRVLLARLFELVPVPLILSRERDQVVILANRFAAELFKVPLRRLVGHRMPDFWVRPDERAAMLEALRGRGRVEGLEAEARTGVGTTQWHLLSVFRTRSSGEDLILAAGYDITAQKALLAQLQELSTRDALTRLINRRRFLELAELEVARAHRYGRPLAVAMIDLDRFKHINDRHGHASGDRVLAAFARTCERALRQHDVVARYGGEEFAVILPETTLPGAEAVVERLRLAAAAERLRGGGRAIRYTVSIGLTAVRRRNEGIAALLRRADAALYRAKRAGRDRVLSG